MRVIKKSEVRKIIIGHVELTLIFLFDYLLCKIAILESLKVLFLDKKQKLLSVDGKQKKCGSPVSVCSPMPWKKSFNSSQLMNPSISLSKTRKACKRLSSFLTCTSAQYGTLGA